MELYTLKSFWGQALFFGLFMTLFSAVLEPGISGNQEFSWLLVAKEAVIWFPAGIALSFANKRWAKRKEDV